MSNWILKVIHLLYDNMTPMKAASSFDPTSTTPCDSYPLKVENFPPRGRPIIGNCVFFGGEGGGLDMMTIEYPFNPNPLRIKILLPIGKGIHQSDEAQATQWFLIVFVQTII